MALLGTHRWRHHGTAYFPALSPDETLLATSGSIEGVSLWDAKSGDCCIGCRERTRWRGLGARGQDPGLRHPRGRRPLGHRYPDENDPAGAGGQTHRGGFSPDGKLLATRWGDDLAPRRT